MHTKEGGPWTRLRRVAAVMEMNLMKGASSYRGEEKSCVSKVLNKRVTLHSLMGNAACPFPRSLDLT